MFRSWTDVLMMCYPVSEAAPLLVRKAVQRVVGVIDDR